MHVYNEFHQFQPRKLEWETQFFVVTGFWGGLVPENAANLTILDELLSSGALGLKVIHLVICLCFLWFSVRYNFHEYVSPWSLFMWYAGWLLCICCWCDFFLIYLGLSVIMELDLVHKLLWAFVLWVVWDLVCFTCIRAEKNLMQSRLGWCKGKEFFNSKKLKGLSDRVLMLTSLFVVFHVSFRYQWLSNDHSKSHPGWTSVLKY